MVAVPTNAEIETKTPAQEQAMVGDEQAVNDVVPANNTELMEVTSARSPASDDTNIREMPEKQAVEEESSEENDFVKVDESDEREGSSHSVVEEAEEELDGEAEVEAEAEAEAEAEERESDEDVDRKSADVSASVHAYDSQTEPTQEIGEQQKRNSEEDKEPSSGAQDSKTREAVHADTKENHAEELNEQINEELLNKQIKFIKDAQILNHPSFRNLSDQQKSAALIALLNSNPATSMPFAAKTASDTNDANRNTGKTPPVARTSDTQPESTTDKQKYSDYLHGETRITEIQSFPPKSRLFIGNLPLKNVTKEDLFRIFSHYGHIFQINIKNAFGFIQYDNPKSVLDAISHESEELNFGKKLILEVSSSNARPQFDHGDHGTNTSSTYVTSSKRNYENEENDEDDMYSDNHYKKSKKRTPQCLIYVKKTADRTYAYNVFTNVSKKTGLETDMVVLKPRMELRRLVNEAAYDGVWGVILINKNKNVDVQTFYQGPTGETKSDEYVAISMDETIAIFNNIKNKRMGPAPISPVVNQAYGMPQHSLPPQQPYGYMAPPPQQYPNVGLVPQQQIYGNIPPPGYGMQPLPQQHGYQSYPQQPLMMQQQGGLDQNQLLAALQNLPPNVVSNLLQLAQQPNQQQQQQALGMIQQIKSGIPLQQQQQNQLQQQPQQLPQQQQAYGNYMAPQTIPGNQPIQQNQALHPIQPQQETHNHGQIPVTQQAPEQEKSQPPQQQQSQAQVQNNNNVQSLLDSLAKLQK